MEILFRFATLDDLAPLVALVNSAYRGESSRQGWTTEADILDGQRTDEDSLRADIENPSKQIVCGFNNDRLVACIALEWRRDNSCYFGMLTVDPTLQANGVGKRLLDHSEGIARTRGATKMRMCVIDGRNELIAWYERRGYSRTGERCEFPVHDPKFGLPKRHDLYFSYFEKSLR